MREELSQLDEIIGFNRVSSGSDISPEKGKAVAQMENQATDVNLDHLYRADKGLVKEIYKAVGHLHRMSVIINPEYYIPIFGEESVARILASAPYDEIGIDVEAQPTAAEWQDFYNDIDSLSKTGALLPEDKVALRRFNSLKQAQSYLRVLSRKRKQQALQEQSMLIDKNGEVQQQSNEQTTQNSLLLENEKRKTIILERQLDSKIGKEKHEQKMAEIALMIQMQNEGKSDQEVIAGEYQIAAVKAKPAPTKAQK
jgi:hypothetical protein